MQASAQFVFRKSYESILLALNAHDLLSPAQLTYLRYRPGSLTYAYDLLRLLSHHGYAASFILIPTLPKARPRVLYGLGKHGRTHLKRLGVPITTRYRPCEDRERTSATLAHTEAISDLVISARLLSRVVPGLELVQVVSERAFKKFHDRVRFQRADGVWQHSTVIPDTLLRFQVQGASQTPSAFPVAVEIDRGTHHRKSFQTMIRSRLAWAKSPFQERFQTECKRLAVVVSMERFAEKRLQQLLSWTQAVLKDLWLDNSATVDWFRFSAVPARSSDPRTFFLSPSWYRPFDPQPLPLFDLHRGILTARFFSPTLSPTVIWQNTNRSSDQRLRQSLER